VTDTVNTDMNDYWNGVGGQRWLRFQEQQDVNLLPFSAQAIEKAAVRSGEAVLDIGCGCGEPAIALARAVGPGGRVQAVDISEPILARAKAQAAAASQTNMTFKKADAQTYAFEEGAFDLVFSRFGVMFFDDPSAAFGNIRRALKAGGRMSFICWRAAKDNEWMRLPMEIAGRHIALPEPVPPGAPGPNAFADGARLQRILSDAGFAGVAVEACDTPFTFSGNLESAVQYVMEMGPAGRAILQAEADDAAKARIAADLREAFMPRETRRGVTLGASTWVVSARNS